MLFCLSLVCLATPVFATQPTNATQSPADYEVLAERTHKTQSFTEGLFIINDEFYESSGLYGKSYVARYPVQEPESTWARLSAPYTARKNLPESVFGEGFSVFGQQVYVLTWQEKRVYVFNQSDFSLVKELPLQGEGWGLTTANTQLIRSDGSDKLYFHNPATFAIEKTLNVTYNGQAITNINELEYHQGYVWANIWHDNSIIKINLTDGKVKARYDLTKLVKTLNLKDPESVLNGIAYDEKRQAFWLTGKNWPKLFLVRFKDAP